VSREWWSSSSHNLADVFEVVDRGIKIDLVKWLVPFDVKNTTPELVVVALPPFTHEPTEIVGISHENSKSVECGRRSPPLKFHHIFLGNQSGQLSVMISALCTGVADPLLLLLFTQISNSGLFLTLLQPDPNFVLNHNYWCIIGPGCHTCFNC